MTNKVSFIEFENFLEDASRLAVIQRIQRVILVVIQARIDKSKVAAEVSSVFERYPRSTSCLTTVRAFLDAYEKPEADLSYNIAEAILHTEELEALSQEDYLEEVFYILRCLECAGCSEQFFYASIKFDLSIDEIKRELT